MYIGNVLLIYRTKCTLNRIKIHAQNKSDKIVFSKRRATRRLEKNDLVTPVFRVYLDCNQSDIYIGNIRLIYRTNCILNRTKKTHAKQVGYFRLYIGQIRRLEKNYTFCEPCFLSLFRLKNHGLQNV